MKNLQDAWWRVNYEALFSRSERVLSLMNIVAFCVPLRCGNSWRQSRPGWAATCPVVLIGRRRRSCWWPTGPLRPAAWSPARTAGPPLTAYTSCGPPGSGLSRTTNSGGKLWSANLRPAPTPPFPIPRVNYGSSTTAPVSLYLPFVVIPCAS